MKLILMRGLPGSGKSTVTKTLGEGGVVLSTDDYFMVDGKYCFNGQKSLAHAWNQDRAKKAMADRVPVVVIDNTNIRLWEMQAYVKLADEFNYEVSLEFPTSPWRDDPHECFLKNSHGVPLEVIQRMKQSFQPCSTIDEIRSASR